MSADAASVAGNIVKGVGAFAAGQANARALHAAAKEEGIAGAAQEAQIREVSRKAIGEQVAGQFSNGFQGGTGSALDALHESAVNAAIDAMRVRREASLRAENLRKQGHHAAVQSWFDLASGILQAGTSWAAMKSDWAAARSGQTPRQPMDERTGSTTRDGSGMSGGIDVFGGGG